MSNSKLILAAGLIGVGIGILLAPKKGAETQKDLLDSIESLGEEIGEIKDKFLGIAERLQTKMTEVKDKVEDKVEDVKEGVSDFKTTADHIKAIFS